MTPVWWWWSAGCLLGPTAPEGAEATYDAVWADMDRHYGLFEVKPDDHATIVLLADAYIGGGYYAEAGQLLETSIQNHPRRRSPELAELQQRMSRLAQVAGSEIANSILKSQSLAQMPRISDPGSGRATFQGPARW